ncbi:hypothetical protein C3B58_14890 [Lactonifactor longoviformis]|uniref:Uncharacterized protein n=1 Tax=Lactonifactor longoviformis DSM 17459 TaxID=1122155 RepID=A0A1M4T932_9CLOT|nr:hypothetical protein [Lactonifactor longoviformis]POP31787.1 hypothetical protein C3B58_14890 [Lactonifactor longoviformis]SHE40848.1 hypothetical protein SAMN02745158_00480 [Lactonifactor longoviformis DSM 17459]
MKNRALFLIWLLSVLLCFCFFPAAVQAASPQYDCSSARELYELLLNHPGSTISLTDDIIWDTWTPLPQVSAPTKINMGDFSILVPEDYELYIQGPLYFEGSAADRPLFVVEGSLSTENHVEITARGDSATAIFIGENGFWYSDLSSVFVEGPNSTGVYFESGLESEITAARVQAEGNGSVGIDSHRPLQLVLCNISSDGGQALKASEPVRLDQCLVTPSLPDAEVISRHAVISEERIQESGLCFPQGVSRETVYETALTYRLLCEEEGVYEISYLTSFLWEDSLVDYNLPGTYLVSLVPQVPEWFPAALPSLDIPVHIVDPDWPFLMAAYQLMDSVGIQFFTEITDAAEMHMYYSDDNGASWNDILELPGSYLDCYGAQVYGLKEDKSYLFCLAVTGGTIEGISNVLPFTFGDPDPFGGGDNDGGDRTEQKLPPVSQAVPEAAIPSPPVTSPQEIYPHEETDSSSQTPDRVEPSVPVDTKAPSAENIAPKEKESSPVREESTDSITAVSGARLRQLLEINPDTVLFEKNGLSVEIPSTFLASLSLSNRGLLEIDLRKIDELSFQLSVTADGQEIAALPETSVSLSYTPSQGTDHSHLTLVHAGSGAAEPVTYSEKHKIASSKIYTTGSFTLREYSITDTEKTGTAAMNPVAGSLSILLTAAAVTVLILVRRRRMHETN